jgi:hypothetical protein
MTNLIEKIGDLASGITTTRSYEDVAEVLAKLQVSGTKVAIKFQGDSVSYSSSVSAFSAKHKVFVLDDMQPPAPPSAFRKGRTVTVTTGDKGRAIKLDSKYLEHLVPNQNLGYQMKIAGRLQVVESDIEFDPMLERLSSANAPIHGAKRANYAEM